MDDKALAWIQWAEKLPTRYVIGIGAVTGGLLYSARYRPALSDAVGMTAWVNQHRFWFGVVFLVSAVLLLGHIGTFFHQIGAGKREAKAAAEAEQAALKQLLYLSHDEWRILLCCLSSQQQTIPLSMLNRRQMSAATAMYNKGLLIPSMGYVVGDIPYTVPTYVWEHLLSADWSPGTPYAEAVKRVKSDTDGTHDFLCRYG
jgi:hypothetical protein